MANPTGKWFCSPECKLPLSERKKRKDSCTRFEVRSDLLIAMEMNLPTPRKLPFVISSHKLKRKEEEDHSARSKEFAKPSGEADMDDYRLPTPKEDDVASLCGNTKFVIKLKTPAGLNKPPKFPKSGMPSPTLLSISHHCSRGNPTIRDHL